MFSRVRGTKRNGILLQDYEENVPEAEDMSDREGEDGGESEGVILNSGYLTQGENQTVTGGLSLLFPKNGKRYGVLQNTGPLRFCLLLYKDEKAFLKKDKKSKKFTEFHFTANIHIHSLEMMMGRTGKPQNIFIIVHGGLPRYFKPHKSAEMMNWVRGFQKVQNAITRKETMAKGQKSHPDKEEFNAPSGDPEVDDVDGTAQLGEVTNRGNRAKRPHEDSGFESPPSTPRCSIPSSDPAPAAAAPVDQERIADSPSGTDNPDVTELLPAVIEIDLPEQDEDDGEDGGEGASGIKMMALDLADDGDHCRRSRMVLNKDRYEEQFVGNAPIPAGKISKSIERFEGITEDDGEKKKPEPQPRKLKSLKEIRENIVTMRLSTWPNRPPSASNMDPEKEPPYQKSLFKIERQASIPDAPDDDTTPRKAPAIPPKVGNAAMGKWKTNDLVNKISKQLEGKERPIAVSSRQSFKQKLPARPPRHSNCPEDDDEERESVEVIPTDDSEVDPDHEPPYDRLKYGKETGTVKGEQLEGGVEAIEEEVEAEKEEEEKGETIDNAGAEERQRLQTLPLMGARPLPKPNEETDWKNIGNMIYEQSSRSVRVHLDKADVKDNLALISVNNSVCIGGWKKECSERVYGKLHVGDFLLQVNDMLVDDPDVAQLFIKSAAKEELSLVVKRLPHAAIKELRKSADQTSWGLETHKNEIREVNGPALDGGITPKVTGVMSNKQNDWVVTELAHQRVPLAKCPQDEVKHRLEKLSDETSLVIILHPRDFILEIKDGLKRLKHPSQFYI